MAEYNWIGREYACIHHNKFEFAIIDRVLNMSHTRNSEVVLQVNEYLFRDGHIQKSVKDLR